jgi:hypothetical protein
MYSVTEVPWRWPRLAETCRCEIKVKKCAFCWCFVRHFDNARFRTRKAYSAFESIAVCLKQENLNILLRFLDSVTYALLNTRVNTRITQHRGAFVNHRYHEKATNITYCSVCACLRVRACMSVSGRLSVCMRLRACSLATPTCNAYAPYCDVICGSLVSIIFFDIIS